MSEISVVPINVIDHQVLTRLALCLEERFLATCIVRASQAGNTLYSAAPVVAQSFAVHLVSQTISFPALGSQAVGANPALTATATSGLAVSYTSTTTSVCTVSGSTASMVAAGTCVLHAAQAGNTVYAAAPAQAQSFAVKAE